MLNLAHHSVVTRNTKIANDVLYWTMVLAREKNVYVFFEHLGYKSSPVVNNWAKKIDFWAANEVKM